MEEGKKEGNKSRKENVNRGQKRGRGKRKKVSGFGDTLTGQRALPGLP